jgi:virginiamycin B lyase
VRLLLLPLLVVIAHGECQPDARVASAPRSDAAAAGGAGGAVERTTSDWLARLPDGEVKRRFILDCAGCHPLDDAVMAVAGRPRTREEWARSVDIMLSFAGAHTGFPIMAPSRDAAATADWLAEHLTELPPPATTLPDASGWSVEEFPLPRPGDLPHDVAVTADGHVVVTGMMSDVLYVLDPESGSFEEIAIPVSGANPRAVEIAPDGAWWVVLGGPTTLARRDPASGEWRTWDVGVYPHEAALDSAGRAWFNGHFTKEPELLGFVDPSGLPRPVTLDVPVPTLEDGGSNIPYGLRVAPDGKVWMTELAGGRLIGLDPASGEFRVHPLPEPFSGPRRLDVAADGTVWVPEFAANRLAAFDPATSRFREYEIPIADALPYVARVDPRSGAIWVSLAGAGAVVRFDPAREAFDVVPLPTRDGIVRHLSVDPRTGDVWGAYGSFPARSQHVFRIRAR